MSSSSWWDPRYIWLFAVAVWPVIAALVTTKLHSSGGRRAGHFFTALVGVLALGAGFLFDFRSDALGYPGTIGPMMVFCVFITVPALYAANSIQRPEEQASDPLAGLGDRIIVAYGAQVLATSLGLLFLAYLAVSNCEGGCS